MAYDLKGKLVIGIASSALFDLTEENEIFEKQGLDAYRKYQKSNKKTPFKTGVAFPFVKRLLSLNERFEERPIEVILLSRNDPDTGIRIFNSIEHNKLDISRAGFLNGRSPYKYIPAFNINLFLSANADDVKKAINQGYPAGLILHDFIQDDPDDFELRIAFDFDGVIVDDEAETEYAKNSNLEDFQKHEIEKADIPLKDGPIAEFIKKLSNFQRLEIIREKKEKEYKRILRIAIVTARNAPAHERCINTLEKRDIIPDETFFLGGINKKYVLQILKPHLFLDDQKNHLDLKDLNIPCIHIPYGIRNKDIKG